MQYAGKALRRSPCRNLLEKRWMLTCKLFEIALQNDLGNECMNDVAAADCSGAAVVVRKVSMGWPLIWPKSFSEKLKQ